ncbi:hypothetical protein ACFLS4_00835 [Bacteroidota bacterium]
MKKIVFCFTIMLIIVLISFNSYSQESKKWRISGGIHGFKYSVNNQPNELLYNPVFEKWENINHQSDLYDVSEYSALDPLSFNMNIGIDALIRYKKYLMIKIGYDYSNPIGIGGTGNINYTDLSSGSVYEESKEFSYTSHQITYFIGPIVQINENGPEIFMGFSMMSPTWVNYNERYKLIEDDIVIEDYDLNFKGFFGNCRMLIGMQVPIKEKLTIGTEAVFSFFNGIELESGNIVDEGFKFPDMRFDISLRYKFK